MNAITIRMDRSQIVDVKTIAHAEGTTVSKIVRDYLVAYADEHRQSASEAMMRKATQTANGGTGDGSDADGRAGIQSHTVQ